MGSIDEAINDPDTRNCLNVEQALTDFADIIQHIKKNLSAPNSPVIVIGGSYAGSKYLIHICWDGLFHINELNIFIFII